MPFDYFTRNWCVKQKYGLADEPVVVNQKIIHCSGEVKEYYDDKEYMVDGLWFNLDIKSADVFSSDICFPSYHLTANNNNKMYDTILNLDATLPFLEIDKL